MMWDLLLWSVAAAVLFAVEAATVALVTIWFAGGALAALIAAALGASHLWQAAVFFVVSCALLACLRPFVRRYVAPRSERTNADRVIGMVGVVTEPIDELAATGAVRVGGMVWTARPVGGAVIPAGARVTVRAIEGVKLRVEPEQAPAEV